MLVACRLAGLSALEGHYVGLDVSAQFVPTMRQGRSSPHADPPAGVREQGGLPDSRVGRADARAVGGSKTAKERFLDPLGGVVAADPAKGFLGLPAAR